MSRWLNHALIFLHSGYSQLKGGVHRNHDSQHRSKMVSVSLSSLRYHVQDVGLEPSGGGLNLLKEEIGRDGGVCFYIRFPK